MKTVFCTGANSDCQYFLNFFFLAHRHDLWLPAAMPQAAPLALLLVPVGMGSAPKPLVRKPSKAAPGTSPVGGMGWTSCGIAVAPSHLPGCPAITGRQQAVLPSHGEWGAAWPLVGASGERGGAQSGKGRRGSRSAFVGLPTSSCSCACRGFFPGSNEDRAEADFTLEQCFISLCNSVYFPWAKPNGKYHFRLQRNINYCSIFFSLARLLPF